MSRCALSVLMVLMVLAANAVREVRAADNGGLGPLSIRNQFPVTLGFLTYTPDTVLTLPEGTFQMRYQYSLTNSFINTQSPKKSSGPYIDNAVVSRGIVATDFNTLGYGLYLDVEAARHQFRFNYALNASLEIGLEIGWIGFSGGSLDSRIEGVENFFGGVNEDRLYSDRNRFDFYLVRNGTFLRQSSQPFSSEPVDPVFNLKWTLTEGGEALPAMAIKFSYKYPLDSTPEGPRVLISSGRPDYGYYFMFAKEIGFVVAHIQFGVTRLGGEPDTFSNSLRHKMFGWEFRLGEQYSLIMQSVSQTSIFSKTNFQTDLDYSISNQTDVGVMGLKYKGGGSLFEFGLIEDYNQQRNESDITFYFELGWEW